MAATTPASKMNVKSATCIHCGVEWATAVWRFMALATPIQHYAYDFGAEELVTEAPGFALSGNEPLPAGRPDNAPVTK